MNKEEADERKRDNPSPHPNRGYRDKEEDMRLWGILIFGLIGATVTTFAELRYELSQSSWKTGNSFRNSFQEEARKRYNRRMREEYETEMERVERIRRMQSVFNRERNKSKRRHDNWQQYGPGAYHQHFQRNDWYWKEDASFRDHGSNFRETPWASASSPLSHHYSVLGLDRMLMGQGLGSKYGVMDLKLDSVVQYMHAVGMLVVFPYILIKEKFRVFVSNTTITSTYWLRTQPYTDDEIKSAFRAKAKEFHPDQNQDNKEFAEAKFKEVMVSYEAIKSERKNNRHP
ncbi:hypothetical protein DH2020_035464 [Rehmannia glutinosa]|uniref:J domain-containing protein n=1 Tax=Rehmannia glutinosa TaxID=99300 RepID=A0ABR0V9P5_REHGL